MIHITLHITLADKGRQTYYASEALDDAMPQHRIISAVEELLCTDYPTWATCTILMHHTHHGVTTHNDFIRLTR